MPFCEACDRHWTPTSMRPDGSCPDCGRVLPLVEARVGAAGDVADPVDEGREAGEAGQDGEGSDAELPSAPWHFKVMLVALAAYLAWRGVQGVEWLVDRL